MKKMTLTILTTLLFFVSSNCTHDDHSSHDHSDHEDSHENHDHASHQNEKEEDHKNHEEGHDDHDHSSHDEHGHEEASPKFGEKMAILWADEKTDQFELSDRLVDLVQIKKINLTKYVFGGKKGYYLIPKSAFVEMKNEYGLYKIKDNKVKLYKVRLIQKKNSDYLIFSKKLLRNESIVISGVPIIRAAELQVFGEGGHGHAH